MDKDLWTAGRKMLRMIYGAPKRPEEELSEYVQRATYVIETIASNLGHESWEESHRRQKFRFAGRTAQTSDGRWSKRLMTWIPWFRPGPDFGRSVRRPKQRWAGELEKNAGGN